MITYSLSSLHMVLWNTEVIQNGRKHLKCIYKSTASLVVQPIPLKVFLLFVLFQGPAQTPNRFFISIDFHSQLSSMKTPILINFCPPAISIEASCSAQELPQVFNCASDLLSLPFGGDSNNRLVAPTLFSCPALL